MSKQKEIPFGTIVVIHQAIDDENEVYLKGVHGDFDATDIQDFQDEISTVLTGEDYFQGEGVYTLKPTIDYYDYHHEITFELVSFEPLIGEEVLMQGTNWVNRNERTPDGDGKYFTFGSHGRTTAWWKGNIQKFQNAESGENEGMQDMDGEVYIVTHWMNLPEKPEPPMPEGE